MGAQLTGSDGFRASEEPEEWDLRYNGVTWVKQSRKSVKPSKPAGPEAARAVADLEAFAIAEEARARAARAQAAREVLATVALQT